MSKIEPDNPQGNDVKSNNLKGKIGAHDICMTFREDPRLSLAIVPLQEIAQGGYVTLRHLQGLELAELVIGAEARHDLAQLIEGVVQAVHSTSLTRIRGETPALENRRRWRDVAGSSSTLSRTHRRRGRDFLEDIHASVKEE